MEDLRREEDVIGYAKRLHHGEIGKGMYDYDAIFSELKGVGFDGSISLDGVDGVDPLRRSVTFLRQKIAGHSAGLSRPRSRVTGYPCARESRAASGEVVQAHHPMSDGGSSRSS